jgi:hypothetical protein
MCDVAADTNFTQNEAEKKANKSVCVQTLNECGTLSVWSRSNDWSHRSGNKTFKETFNRFPETDNCAWNVTHIALSTAL